MSLKTLFTYHPPDAETVPKYERINAAALALAEAIQEEVPIGRDRNLAIDHVRIARMLANSGVATKGAARA